MGATMVMGDFARPQSRAVALLQDAPQRGFTFSRSPEPMDSFSSVRATASLPSLPPVEFGEQLPRRRSVSPNGGSRKLRTPAPDEVLSQLARLRQLRAAEARAHAKQRSPPRAR